MDVWSLQAYKACAEPLIPSSWVLPTPCRDITGVTAISGNLPASFSLSAQGIPGCK